MMDATPSGTPTFLSQVLASDQPAAMTPRETATEAAASAKAAAAATAAAVVLPLPKRARAIDLAQHLDTTDGSLWMIIVTTVLTMTTLCCGAM